MPFSAKTRRGFTLLELLVSVAIVGILSAIVVGGLGNQKNIGLARRLAEQLQGDIQAAQNSSLSGQVVGGSRPAGFGVVVDMSTVPLSKLYRTFADAYIIGSNPLSGNNTYDAGEELVTTNFDSTMVINKITITGIDSSNAPKSATPNALSIVYSMPNGNLTITPSPAPNPPFTIQQGIVQIKNTKLNVCYNVTVTVASGTVSNRALTTCGS